MIDVIAAAWTGMITRLPMATDVAGVTLLLAPNRALSQRQLRSLAGYLSIAALLVAGLAALAGDVFAVLFALLEVPVLALAFRAVWRSGNRGERITFDAEHLRVEQLPSKGRPASSFPAAWTRVRELDRGDGHRHVVLAAHGREQEVGMCLGDDERGQLSRSLKSLLATCSGWRDN